MRIKNFSCSRNLSSLSRDVNSLRVFDVTWTVRINGKLMEDSLQLSSIRVTPKEGLIPREDK